MRVELTQDTLPELSPYQYKMQVQVKKKGSKKRFIKVWRNVKTMAYLLSNAYSIKNVLVLDRPIVMQSGASFTGMAYK